MRAGLTSLLAAAVSTACAFAAMELLPTGQSVDLSTVSGRLERCSAGFCVGESPVYFGPEWYLGSTTSNVDHDRDGRLTTLLEELHGVVGQEVLLEVAAGTDRSSVYVVNGSPWRELGQPAPWSKTGESPGALTSGDQTPPSEPIGRDAPGTPVSLEGSLESCGSSFCLDGDLLEFGPWWFLHHSEAAHDYDRDGTTGTPAEELEGLAGTHVRLEVLIGDGVHDVITLNGLPWQPIDGPPPWVGGPVGKEAWPNDRSVAPSSSGPTESLETSDDG